MHVNKIYEVAGRRKYVNGIYKRSKTAAEKLEIDSINAVKCVMMGKYSTRPVWGKLYKRDIIEKTLLMKNTFLRKCVIQWIPF